MELTVLCISEVVEDETALLRYLSEKGIRPGAQLLVQDAGPDDWGPLTLAVAHQAAALDHAIADKVWAYRNKKQPATDHSVSMAAPTTPLDDESVVRPWAAARPHNQSERTAITP